jgi:hypothetical protein
MVSPQVGSIVRYSTGEKTPAGTYTSPMASAAEFHRCGASMNNRSAWCYIDSDGDPHLVITNFQTGNEISDTVLDLATTHDFRTDYHTVRFGNMLAIAFSTNDDSVVVYEVSVNNGGATIAVEGSFEITQGSVFGTHVCFVEDRGSIFCISTSNGSPTNEVFVFPCYMQGVVQSTMAVTEMVIECTLNTDTDSIYAINSQSEPANFIFINGDVASYCISIVSQGLATAVTVLGGLQNVSYMKGNDYEFGETNTVTPLALTEQHLILPNL